MTTHYHQEDILFAFDQERHNKWLSRCFEKLGLHEPDISYIFCSDAYLVKINKEQLNHDYKTDIITFDNRLTNDGPLFADLFISIETVRSNSVQENTGFADELRRVMVHGVLHLCGFNDKSSEESQIMREEENRLLSINY
jgi:probable rRNA maturation factor